MTLFISTKRLIAYDAGDKSEKLEAKGQIRERKLLLKVERYFRPAENPSSNQHITSKNSLKDTLQKGACGISETKSLCKGRNYQSCRPISSFAAEEDGQDRKIDHDRHDTNKKRRRVV